MSLSRMASVLFSMTRNSSNEMSWGGLSASPSCFLLDESLNGKALEIDGVQVRMAIAGTILRRFSISLCSGPSQEQACAPKMPFVPLDSNQVVVGQRFENRPNLVRSQL